MFLSVQWESGNHPERLAKALRRYGAVFSAWDGSRLAGLVAALRTVVTAGALLVTSLRAVIVVARLIGTVMLESFMAFSVGRCIFYITVCIE